MLYVSPRKHSRTREYQHGKSLARLLKAHVHSICSKGSPCSVDEALGLGLICSGRGDEGGFVVWESVWIRLKTAFQMSGSGAFPMMSSDSAR